MKIEYKGQTFDVKLKTAWVNYNCSLKMVGRLRLEGAPEDLKYEKDWRNFLDTVKDKLITEWVESLEVKATFPVLKEGNPIFPQDNGIYLPSVILYSDAINGDYKGVHWAYSFTSFLSELKDPKFGCTIVDLPGYHNRTYSLYGDNPRLCKVWAIYPPSMRQFLFVPNNGDLNPKFKQSTTGDIFQEPYKSEIKRAING